MNTGQPQSELLREYMRDVGSSPTYSSDWLFLPGIPAGEKALVFAGINDGFAVPLSDRFNEIIFINQTPSAVEESEGGSASVKNIRSENTEYLFDPSLKKTCDLVAMPLGLSSMATIQKNCSILSGTSTVLDLLIPGGVFYFGFSNRWDLKQLFGSADGTEGYSNLLQVSRLLKRAGFSSATFYGAIPDHKIPSLVFSLNANTIGFALQRRYQRKLSPIFLALVNNAIAAMVFKFSLPSYCVVARR